MGQFGHLGFIAHYDNDGNFISVKGIGGGSTYFTHLNMYPGTMGNLYLTGSISAYNTQLFLEDTNPQTLNSNGKFELWPQNEDAFIIKYSNEGDIKWIKMISNSFASYVSDLVIDELENIYIAGWFTGTIDFDSDKILDYDTKTSASKGSGYVAKYNSDGELKWLKTIKGGTLTQVKTLELFNERLVLGGNFQGSNIQFGNTFQNNSTNSDSFISILNTKGDWINTEFIPSTDHSSINQLDIEPNGTIHFLGYNADTYTDILNMSKIFFGEIRNALQAPTVIETEFNNTIFVYPNPTKDFIHIKSTMPIDLMELYSISGDQIWFRKKQQKEDIDMKNISQGIYLLKVHFVNGQTKTIKVVKK